MRSTILVNNLPNSNLKNFYINQVGVLREYGEIFIFNQYLNLLVPGLPINNSVIELSQ